MLVKAGSLIAAEIDRLRLAAPLTPIVAVDAGALDLPDGTPVVSVPNEGALP